MKRIVLIGNGFDRSIGAPTTYQNVLDYFLQKEISNLLNEIDDSMPVLRLKGNQIAIHTTTSFALWLKENCLKSSFTLKQLNDAVRSEKPQIGGRFIKPIDWLSPFYRLLFNEYETNNWVDIERMFFSYLSNSNKSHINRLNDNMKYLVEVLNEYLNKLEIRASASEYGYFKKTFFSNRLQFDNSTYDWIESGYQFKEKTIFVNFNYTNFLGDVLTKTTLLNESQIIHIHGNLLDSESLIFGYGNEEHPNYKKIEALEDNRFLKYMKSSHYAKRSEYQSILYNLNKEYEVYIYGLSCGLSDKLLLNEILENDNCKQIRIFFHKYKDESDNFEDTYNNISRSFSNKSKLREKVISKRETDVIKQFNLLGT